MTHNEQDVERVKAALLAHEPTWHSDGDFGEIVWLECPTCDGDDVPGWDSTTEGQDKAREHQARAALDAMGLPSRERVYSVLESAQENGWTWGKTTDAILALLPAAYKPEVAELTSTYTPRTVTSVEELPPRSRVTIDGGDDVMTKGDYGEWRGGPYTLGKRTWVGLPDDPLESPPVVCIYRPDGTALTPATAPTVTAEQVSKAAEYLPGISDGTDYHMRIRTAECMFRAAGIEVAK